MNDKVVSSSQYLAGFLVSMDLKKIDDIVKEKNIDKKQYDCYIIEYDNYVRKILNPVVM